MVDLSDRKLGRAIHGEAFRNIRATPVRTIVTAALTMVLGALTVLAASFDVSAIHDRWLIAVGSGSTTFVVTSQRLNSIPASRCDQLRSVSSVVSAGGRTASRSVSPYPFTSERVQLEVVTPGFSQIMWPGLAGTNASVVPSPAVAERFGLTQGATLALGAERTASYEVTAVPPGKPRVPQFSNSLLVAGAPVGTVNECYVESAPGAVSDVEKLLSGWFDPGLKPSVLRFVVPKSTDVDSQGELEQRTSRVAPLVAGMVLVIFALGAVWAKRQEYALYKLLGLNLRGLTRMLTVEWLLLYGIPLAAGFTAGMLFAAKMLLLPVVWTAAATDIAVLVLLAATIPAMATLIIHRTDPINAIKGQ